MKKIYTRLVPLLVLVGSSALAGCEVVAEFDRTKIDAGEASFDASSTDSTVPDAANPDTSTPDATADAQDDGAALDGVAPDGGEVDAAADAPADTAFVPDAADAAAE